MLGARCDLAQSPCSLRDYTQHTVGTEIMLLRIFTLVLEGSFPLWMRWFR